MVLERSRELPYINHPCVLCSGPPKERELKGDDSILGEQCVDDDYYVQAGSGSWNAGSRHLLTSIVEEWL
jgi:hypothetical protein